MPDLLPNLLSGLLPALLPGLLLGLAACSGPAPQSPLDRTPLVELLPLADLVVETSSLEFGDSEAQASMASGWSRPTRTGERSFAWGLGSSSVVELELAWRRPLALTLQGAPFSFPGSGPQHVEVWLNGHPVGGWVLATPGRRNYALELPAAAQVVGTNALELRYAYSQRPRDLGAGSQDPRSLAVKWHRLQLGPGAEPAAPRVQADALLLPAASRVGFYLRLPEGGRLLIEKVLPWRQSASALRIGIEAAGVPERTREITVPASGEQGFELELPAVASGPVRLTLTAASASAARGLRLVAPQLLTPRRAGAALDQVSNLDGWPASEITRPNVILYVIDTLRADHLGCYGYERPTSPEIDRFAADAALFTAAKAQSPWTRPSVASILTGLNPQMHGVNGRDDGLPQAAPSLAALMQEAGYETAAVVTNGNIGRSFGFARGFDHFISLGERAGSRELHVLSDRVNREALEWLEGREGTRPFFLYLHTSDPHGPYTPRPPFKERFAAEVTDPELGATARLAKISASTAPIAPAVLEGLVGLYDGEIAFNDASFGALMRQLEALGLAESSLVILTSDHGEEFKEHGRLGHGHSLFEEQLAIPLIARFPNGVGRGLRIDGMARQIDILPTVLEMAGVPVPAAVQGRSLLPRLFEAAPGRHSSEASYAFSGLGRRGLESVELQGRKLVERLEGEGFASTTELFDLTVDPWEQADLSADQPVWRGYLFSLLRYRREFWPELDAPRIEADEALRRRLEAAGYLN